MDLPYGVLKLIANFGVQCHTLIFHEAGIVTQMLINVKSEEA